MLGRHPPCDDKVYKQKYDKYDKMMTQNIDPRDLTAEELENVRQENHERILKYLKTKIHAWEPEDYTAHNCILYLLGRGMPEYAVLYKIMYEIKMRDKKYTPESVFDFGSGLGTAIW